MDKPYWSTRDISVEAERLGRPVTQRYLQKLCKRGDLEYIQPARDYLIPVAAAQEWLATWTKKTKPME